MAMTAQERELLQVCIDLIEQYMPSSSVGVYDHCCMGAGEGAVDVLKKYGLAIDTGYSIQFTPKRFILFK